MNKLNAVLLAALSLFAVGAQAAAVDVSAVVTDIAAQAAPIALIGAAVLILMVGIKAFKWVRRAM
jgi:hypothetical protein